MVNYCLSQCLLLVTYCFHTFPHFRLLNLWTSIWKEEKEKVSFPHYYCSKTSHESIFFHAKVTVTHIISQGGSSSGTSSMNDTHKSFNITFLRFWRVHTTTARGLIHPPFFYSGRILQCSISRFSSLGTLLPPISVLKSGDFNASYKFWWFQRLLNCTIIIIKVRFWRFFTDVFVVAFWWSVMFWWLINDRASSWVLASFATTLLLKLLHPHHVTVCALILFLFER